MAKIIKVQTIDDGIVWINKEEIIYIMTYEAGKSLITMKNGRRFKVYGNPDYVMMHTIGT